MLMAILQQGSGCAFALKKLNYFTTVLASLVYPAGGKVVRAAQCRVISFQTQWLHYFGLLKDFQIHLQPRSLLVLSWIILDIPRADTSHLHLVHIKKEFIEIV